MRKDKEDNKDNSVADQIDRLITDAENWMRPRPRITVLDMPYPEEWKKEDEECEKSRDNAVRAGKSIAAALVKRGERPRAVFTILNSLESQDYAQARKNWPGAKADLQEVALRLRLKDDAIRAKSILGHMKSWYGILLETVVALGSIGGIFLWYAEHLKNPMIWFFWLR